MGESVAYALRLSTVAAGRGIRGIGIQYFLRRDQVRAVEAFVKKPLFSQGAKQDLETLTAKSSVATALTSGDVNSVREALRKRNLHGPVQRALQDIQISQRNVRGSEAERDNIMPKSMAMRLWCGCSSLFFALIHVTSAIL